MAKKNQDLSKKKYIEEYVDPITGVTGRQLKIGYWWVTHKDLFKKIGVIILGLLATYLALSALIGWGAYLFFGSAQDEAMLRRLSSSVVVNHDRSLAQRPDELQILSTQVFAGKGELYDFVSEMVNPNKDWFVGFEYRFVFRGGETEWKKSFILPGENTLKTELGFEWSQRPREAQFQIRNLDWLRLAPRYVPDTRAYLDDHYDFSVKSADVIPVSQRGDAGTILRLQVENNTAFNFWHVPLYIGLFNGNRLLAVEFAIVEPFKAGSVEELEINSTLTGATPNEILIFPELNVFDSDVIMPLE